MSVNDQQASSAKTAIPAAPFVASSGWQYLKDLPTPSEVAAAVELCWKPDERHEETRQELEERFKLDYFYGGKVVAYLYTPQGLAVVATDDMTQEEYDAAKARLTPAERGKLLVAVPPSWNEARIGFLEST